MFRPPSPVTVPSVKRIWPAGGKENAHGSYQGSGVRSGCPAALGKHAPTTPLVGSVTPGFKFGRSGPVVILLSPFNERLNPVLMFNGIPEPYDQIPLTAQPPRTAFCRRPFRGLANGKSY